MALQTARCRVDRLPGLAARVPHRPGVALGFDTATGCGAAWLACLTGGQEVAGSNPVSPTKKALLRGHESGQRVGLRPFPGAVVPMLFQCCTSAHHDGTSSPQPPRANHVGRARRATRRSHLSVRTPSAAPEVRRPTTDSPTRPQQSRSGSQEIEQPVLWVCVRCPARQTQTQSLFLAAVLRRVAQTTYFL